MRVASNLLGPCPMVVARCQKHQPPKRSKQLALALCALASATVACTRAHADSTDWTLHWEAPKTCPNEQDVRRQVQHWLSQSLAPHDPRGVHVEAKVERRPEGFTLDLTLTSPSGGGREQLVAAQCETLAGVVGLKVALAADPGALLEALDAGASASPRWAMQLTAGLGLGVLPGTAPMFELTGRRTFSRIAIELGAGYAFDKRVHYTQLPAIGADVNLLYARVRGCVLPDIGAVEFPICGGVDLGWLRGRGFGIPEVFTATRPYAALVIGPRLQWPLTRWLAPFFGLEALIALHRPVFHVRNLESLYIPEKIGARVQIGAEIRIE